MLQRYVEFLNRMCYTAPDAKIGFVDVLLDYIQSALSVADEAKRMQEINSLSRVADSFKKIVVVKDDIIPWHDEQGILYIGIEQFLLEETAINI